MPNKHSEKWIEDYVVKFAKEQGVLVTKFNFMGNCSWPDRCFWVPGGKPLLIEFKKPGGELTRLQTHTCATLRKAGYNVQICYNREQGLRAILEALPIHAAKRKILTRARGSGFIGRPGTR